MRRVKQIKLERGMSVDSLVRSYEDAGVLGAGDIGRAASIYEEMLNDKAKVFLGISGPLVPSGLRGVVTDMIRCGYVHVIVTSGANVVHDMIEAYRGGHYVGSFGVDDEVLKQRRIARIGNVFVEMEDFKVFEEKVQAMLASIQEDTRADLSIRELLWEIGGRLEDEGSFLRAALENHVSVFSPGIMDSMLGLQLFFFSQRNRLVLNAVKDMKDLTDEVFDAKKTGAVLLGGGLAKHHIMMVNSLRDGMDYGIQITMDREEAGSLSGAKLEEGISWGKIRSRETVVTSIGDATVLLPLLVASLKERLPC
ncbi:MAG: deoxyhypusine synthase [Candidatus Hydrothermarchaeaceae archaeon]